MLWLIEQDIAGRSRFTHAPYPSRIGEHCEPALQGATGDASAQVSKQTFNAHPAGMASNQGANLIEFLRGDFFWHEQVVIWRDVKLLRQFIWRASVVVP